MRYLVLSSPCESLRGVHLQVLERIVAENDQADDEDLEGAEELGHVQLPGFWQVVLADHLHVRVPLRNQLGVLLEHVAVAARVARRGVIRFIF